MGRDPMFLSALMGEGKKRGDQVNRDKVAGVAPTQQLLYSSHKYLGPWSVQWKMKKKKKRFSNLSLFYVSLFDIILEKTRICTGVCLARHL